MTPFTAIAHTSKPTVVAIGVFDGVHVGHQAVIREAMKAAGNCNGEAWALTFEPHPLSVIRPAQAPDLLTTTHHKQELLMELGLAGCVVIPFTQELATQSPRAFIDELTKHAQRLAGVVVGDNFRFGHRAEGDIELLRRLGAEHQFSTTGIPALLHAGKPVSSTRIRDAIRNSELGDATDMLGRPFSLRGKVEHGKQIGRALGFPTANLNVHGVIRPPAGVYAVAARLGAESFDGAAYIGRRPSYQEGGGSAIIEVHLFDTDKDLYGELLEIDLIGKIRGDMRFSSDAALKQQIGLDIEAVATALTGRREPTAPSVSE